jgi:hypothetical protein
MYYPPYRALKQELDDVKVRQVCLKLILIFYIKVF